MGHLPGVSHQASHRQRYQEVESVRPSLSPVGPYFFPSPWGETIFSTRRCDEAIQLLTQARHEHDD